MRCVLGLYNVEDEHRVGREVEGQLPTALGLSHLIYKMGMMVVHLLGLF